MVVRPERHAGLVEQRLDIPRASDEFLFHEWLDAVADVYLKLIGVG